MGAISTTLNLNGNMETRLSALTKRAETLYSSLQKIGQLHVTPVVNSSSFDFGDRLVESTQKAKEAANNLKINSQDAIKSVQGLKATLGGVRTVTAEVAKGLQFLANSAREADKRVRSLTTALKGLGRVSLSNLNQLSGGALTGSLQRLESALGFVDSATGNLGDSSTRAENAQRRLNGELNSTRGSSTRAANAVRDVGDAAREAANHTASLVASLTAAWAVYGTFHAARSLFETSDKMTSIEGRLRIGVDEGSMREAKAYLQQNMDKIPVGVDIDTASSDMAIKVYKDKLMSIANETRQQFSEVADFATKLMVNVGGKAFKSTNELLDFTKTLNKFIVVSGSTGSEASSVFTQLPQALSSGTLQGDELKSLRENAPLIKNVIQDYANQVLGLQGDIKDLGAEGQITARTVVDAIKWGANEAESKMGKMPWTWAQRWNMFNNTITSVMENVYAKMQRLANMRGTDTMFSDLAKVYGFFAEKVVRTTGIVMALGTALSNEGLLYPILTAGMSALALATITLIAAKATEITVGGFSLLWKIKDEVATAFLTKAQMAHTGVVKLLTGSIINNTWATIGNALATARQTLATIANNVVMAIRQAVTVGVTTATVGGTMAMVAHAAWTAMCTAATWALTAAKGALLVAAGLLLGVIIALAPVIAIVGLAMYVLGSAIGVTTLATWGLNLAIVGIIGVVILVVGAIVMFMIRMLGALQTSRSVIYYIGALFGWLYGVIYNIVAHIWNTIANFANFFANVLDDPCQAWVNLVHAMVDDCLGYLQNLASGIDAVFGSNLAGTVADWKARAKKKVDEIIGTKKAMKTIVNLMEYKDVATTARAAGNGLDSFVGDVKQKIGSFINGGFTGGYEKYLKDINTDPDGNGKAIKDNTGKTAKAVESVAENLDWLITANERRAINSFTSNSYEVPVNVTINGGDRNLAGIAEEIRWNLTSYLTERLNSGAEGAMQGV